jgi:short-subunit dehydrogenase
MTTREPKTALITGASTGIGLEFAKIFAQNGNNLVLVARTQSKLEALAQELSAAKGIKTWVFAYDLSLPESATQLFEACQNANLTIDYLVNNAGFGDYGAFHQSRWQKQADMIQLNIQTLTHLTHLFLPQMIQNRRGKILNVASVAAFQPGPYMSVYFATKAYVLSFSEALAAELEGTGVTVTALCPGPTESEFFKNAQAQDSNLVKGKKLPTAKEVALYGYERLLAGDTVAIHGAVNFILANTSRFMPRSLVTKISKIVMKK